MMRLKLGQTFFKVGSIMMSNPQSPSLDDIKYVLGIYDTTLRPQLDQCQDIRELLELVCNNSSLDDIRTLEFLVDEFNIEEAKPVIEEYKEAVEELKEMKPSQYFKEQLSYVSLREYMLVFVATATPTLCERHGWVGCLIIFFSITHETLIPYSWKYLWRIKFCRFVETQNLN